jgi:hypothetical protein
MNDNHHRGVCVVKFAHKLEFARLLDFSEYGPVKQLDEHVCTGTAEVVRTGLLRLFAALLSFVGGTAP